MQPKYREEELVRAAQRGDQEAFARLYEGNADRVYNYLLGRMAQPADAEDITAEVFLRAMKALSSYKPKGVPFVAWLFRIAHNQALNYMKQQTRRKEVPLLDTVIASDDPAEVAVSRVTSNEVSRAMSGLTDLQREVLSLRFAGQLSIAETAKAMKRSEEAVKFLQHSALRALQRILAQQEGRAHG
ncbi:MAG: RNA polymerase sigma factor [Dehalococcoidia bacterium]